MKRILIVGSQHGNELLGERLYAFIQRQVGNADLEVSFLLANPRARKHHVRYIESDMNRSFAGGNATYEERLAQKLLVKLQDHNYDLVIDAHTTTVSQAPCIIVPEVSESDSSYLRAIHIKNIIVMKHNFLGRSLIGNVPKAISLEVSNAQLNNNLFEKLYESFVAFAEDRGKYRQKHIYNVEDIIAKAGLTQTEAAALVNFRRSKQGFFPVLVGENSYKKQTNYLGFRATHKMKVQL